MSHGACYVQTDSLLEIGARLAMVMHLDGLDLRLIAQVRSVKTDPKPWAGLEFVGVTAEGPTKLKSLIDALAGQKQASS